MRNTACRTKMMLPILIAICMGAVLNRPTKAQNTELQQRVAEIKQRAEKNKRNLFQYTWVEQVTISLKGEQKKTGALPSASRTGRAAPKDFS